MAAESIASGLCATSNQRFLRPFRARAGDGQPATRHRGRCVCAVVALRPPESTCNCSSLRQLGHGRQLSLSPALFGGFWRRATGPGGLVGDAYLGAGVTLSLYVAGTIGQPPRLSIMGSGHSPRQSTPFGAYYLLGPTLASGGSSHSLVVGVVVSWLSRPPDAARVSSTLRLQLARCPGPATLPCLPTYG